MSWDVLKKGLQKTGNLSKKAAIMAGKNIQKNIETRQKKESILDYLTISQLKRFASDYDIRVNRFMGLEGEPTRSDYIRCIAGSLHLPVIEEYYNKKIRGKGSTTRATPTPAAIYNTINVASGQVNIGHQQTNIMNTYNGIMQRIENLTSIDDSTKKEALKKIYDFEKEARKAKPDKSKLEKIIEWFDKHKGELANFVVPFLKNILSTR